MASDQVPSVNKRPSEDEMDEEPSKRKVDEATPEFRFDGVDHWPEPSDQKQRCKLCVTAYSRMRCEKCDVALCLNRNKNCFKRFHIC